MEANNNNLYRTIEITALVTTARNNNRAKHPGCHLDPPQLKPRLRTITAFLSIANKVRNSGQVVTECEKKLIQDVTQSRILLLLLLLLYLNSVLVCLIISVSEFRLVILETLASFLQHAKIALLLHVPQVQTWYVLILTYLVKEMRYLKYILRR